MKIIKTLTLLLLFSASMFAQQTPTTIQFAEGTNMIDLNDAKYAGMSFENIINSYKGKVIYLDFWASWCRPCKNEMPYSLKMQKYFKGKDVVFIYMSSDRNAKAWRNAVKQLKVSGENYLVSGKVHKEYNNEFDVKFIPRYVLYDKEGKVVDAAAKRPSNPEAIKQIEDLL